MNTLEINNYMEDYDCYAGTYPKDMLPLKIFHNRPLGIIINTDPSNKKGEHWVALFVDQNNEAEYFDSFGMKPICCEILSFLKINKINIIKYNKYQFQSIFSQTCGLYCILFLKMRCSNYSYCEFSQLFSDNHMINDKLIVEML